MICTWCGTDFEPRAVGGSVRRFCSKNCRHDFHSACRVWGEEAYGIGEVSIFQLRTCLGRRVCCVERASPAGSTQSPETEKRTDGPPAAVVGVTA